jgi:hypothetical protein
MRQGYLPACSGNQQQHIPAIFIAIAGEQQQVKMGRGR